MTTAAVAVLAKGKHSHSTNLSFDFGGHGGGKNGNRDTGNVLRVMATVKTRYVRCTKARRELGEPDSPM
jgi:hypothetical protein